MSAKKEESSACNKFDFATPTNKLKSEPNSQEENEILREKSFNLHQQREKQHGMAEGQQKQHLLQVGHFDGPHNTQ